jgi:hypothetical protein
MRGKSGAYPQVAREIDPEVPTYPLIPAFPHRKFTPSYRTGGGNPHRSVKKLRRGEWTDRMWTKATSLLFLGCLAGESRWITTPKAGRVRIPNGRGVCSPRFHTLNNDDRVLNFKKDNNY